MTYIEFFDNEASENICACLTYVPERVVYIGVEKNPIIKHIENYKKVFAARGHENIAFDYKIVRRDSLDDVVRVISEIVNEYENCSFDITGGDEILTLALGVVYAKNPEKNIQIHRFNLRNNKIYDCDKDGNNIYHDVPALTIDENIQIYGGDVIYGDIQEQKTYKWDMNEEFKKDIDEIWSICKKEVGFWNVRIGILEEINKKGKKIDEVTLDVKKSVIGGYLKREKLNYKTFKGFVNLLSDKGFITKFDDSGEERTIIVFKNKQIKKMLTTAGQALEMKVYSTVLNTKDKDGNPAYNDVLNGVVIDWDGVPHDERKEGIYDVENEIDILAMHNMIPIFISCKNGRFDSEELYKLNTVSQRFGGSYSKKVLVTTALSSMGESGKYLRQRARDMKIKIIETIDDKRLEAELKKLWESK